MTDDIDLEPPLGKTIWLHIGAPKTGTSAIQTGLAINRARLAEAGVHYPEDRSDKEAVEGKVTSGNGGAIAAFLRIGQRPEIDPESQRIKAGRLLDKALAGSNVALLSSEMMSGAEAEPLKTLVSMAAERGARVKVLYFVRHIADHAYSAYQQRPKTGRVVDFSERLKNYEAPFLSIRVFEQLIGRQAIAVRIYDEHKADLTKAVVEIVTGRDDVVLEPTPRVNRASTPEEREAIRQAAKILHPDGDPKRSAIFRTVTRNATSGPAGPAAPLVISQEELAAIEANNRVCVDGINADYFGGADRLRYKSDKVAIGVRPPITADSDQVAALCDKIVAAYEAQAHGLPPRAPIEPRGRAKAPKPAPAERRRRDEGLSPDEAEVARQERIAKRAARAARSTPAP